MSAMKNQELRMKNVGVRQSSFGNAFALFLATLREIFDENAYARFLRVEQLEPSRESYAAFLRENGFRRERRARCC